MSYSEYAGCKAVIYSGGRRGSTLLLHLLSNHPQVFCLRTGLFGRGAQFRKYLGIKDWRRILDFVWNARGYDVGVGKISYSRPYQEMWDYMVENDVSVIHLVRENALRTALSTMLFRKRKTVGRPWATTEPPEPIDPVHIPPEKLLDKATVIARGQAGSAQILVDTGLRHMTLTYEEMVGPTGEIVGERSLPNLCDFLRIEDRPFYTRMRRVNPEPVSKLLSNYADLAKEARKRGLEEWLDA